MSRREVRLACSTPVSRRRADPGSAVQMQRGQGPQSPPPKPIALVSRAKPFEKKTA